MKKILPKRILASFGLLVFAFSIIFQFALTPNASASWCSTNYPDDTSTCDLYYGAGKRNYQSVTCGGTWASACEAGRKAAAQAVSASRNTAAQAKANKNYCNKYSGTKKTACETGLSTSEPCNKRYSGDNKKACDDGRTKGGGGTTSGIGGSSSGGSSSSGGGGDGTPSGDGSDGGPSGSGSGAEAVDPPGPEHIDCSEAGVNCQDPAASGTCDNDGCDLIGKYVNPAIKALSAIVGVAAVASLIYAGIQYSMSSGDPQKVAEAKDRITKTLIAFVAYLLLVGFLDFLIPGGVIK